MDTTLWKPLIGIELCSTGETRPKTDEDVRELWRRSVVRQQSQYQGSVPTPKLPTQKKDFMKRIGEFGLFVDKWQIVVENYKSSSKWESYFRKDTSDTG